MKTDFESLQRTSGEAREDESRLKDPDPPLDLGRYRESAAEAIKLARRMVNEASRMRTAAAQMQIEAAQIRELLHSEKLARRQYFLNHHGNPAVIFLDPYFLAASDLPTILATAIDAAIMLTGVDMGNVQLFDPALGTLRIEAQRGFEPPFLEYFASVHEGQAACGMALARAERVIVDDVAKSPIFAGAPALDVMIEARARAVQSTPLIGSSGRLLGILSTHSHKPQRPTVSELRLLDLLARVAVRCIERKSASTVSDPL